MLAGWEAEGVGTGLVQRLPGRLPGLYVIQTDAGGERRFSYWRGEAPARQLFDLPATPALVAAMPGYALLYLSGITLSLYGDIGRERLLAALASARAGGSRVAFDTNFRPRGWPDPEVARAAFRRAMATSDIVLASSEDLDLLFGQGLPAELHGAGVELVLKRPDQACRITAPGVDRVVAAKPVACVIDTTAAGDSFAAAYRRHAWPAATRAPRRQPGTGWLAPSWAIAAPSSRHDAMPATSCAREPMTHSLPGGGDLADGAYAFRRLAISLAISTIGGVGMWSAVVVLPAIQAEFGVDRAGASLPYTATMIGFAIGGVAMGRLADRFGIRVPLLVGALMLGLGYLAAALPRATGSSSWPRPCSSACSAAQPPSARWWPTSRTGSGAGAASRWRSSPAATISPARSGRRSCSTPSPASAGVRRMSGSACSASSTLLPLALLLGRRTSFDAEPSTAGGSSHLEAPPVAARRPSGPPGAGRRRLLRRHVDAAGAPRRLLRRSRLRTCPRRPDALSNAGPWRGQPACVGPDRRPDRRRRHADPGLVAPVPCAVLLPAVRRPHLALCRLRRCSACRRAASCPATP